MELPLRNSKGYRLAATLELPAGLRRPPVVVFAHGFRSGRASSRNRAIAESLVASGIAAFLFDFTGHGESEGSIEEATVSQMVGDLGAAIDCIEGRDEPDPGRIGVSGSSSGGIVAIRAASVDARIKALVVRSVPAGGLFEAATSVSAPTLVVAGEMDWPIVEEDRALATFLPGEHQFIVIAGAGHLFEGEGQEDEVARVSARWFVDHLVAPEAPMRREQGPDTRDVAGSCHD